nr:ubiquinone biosynthesis protein COQ4 [Novosphingobium kaempferiae]
MSGNSGSFDLATRRDWGAALNALRQLLSNADDTAQVFRIMRALNAGSAGKGYARLLRTEAGGRIAYRRTELARLLSDASFVASCPPSSVGAAYADFLTRTGYSAKGLAAVSMEDGMASEAEHPHAWFGRRTRDVHDIWHILTGYRADDPLGEACLVAFSYAQTGGLGWAFIALGAAFKACRTPGGGGALRAIREGYRNGRRAAWLLGEDYEAILSEPLDAARIRLRIARPAAYETMGSERAGFFRTSPVAS